MFLVVGCAPEVDVWSSSGPAPDGGPAPVCFPGQQLDCTCPGGVFGGVRSCLSDRSGYGDCLGCPAEAASSSAGGAGGASTGSGGDGGQGGGHEPACTVAEDCPGVDSACAWRACEEGACSVEVAPTGTPLAEQTPGDCRELRCDGHGGQQAAPALDDVGDDGNECTADSCGPAGPTHARVPTGTECAAGLCQDGDCVDYIPVRCKTPDAIYQDCYGFAGSAFQVRWQRPDGAFVGCADHEPGYCGPGWTCIVYHGNGTSTLGTCL
ncbi:hypothetical protein [Sorangium sp. So ce1151]|uniref:hypothetical protein n=1 Tax=Sorangium sp. So ce1151 TaxID=3133332 RepID=UPI003F5EE3E2